MGGLIRKCMIMSLKEFVLPPCCISRGRDRLRAVVGQVRVVGECHTSSYGKGSRQSRGVRRRGCRPRARILGSAPRKRSHGSSLIE
ncbi:UNVERIFIED_CONTAM: hypothetical protein Slati_2496400 [Sesamum latifolium]|uniref:Uncharacterized protein n=1 Tax=Sesamum latifolium TaxID=2727402 RepID=A0AAW2WEJ3_9LAMI